MDNEKVNNTGTPMKEFSEPVLSTLETAFRLARWVIPLLIIAYLFSNTTVIKSDEVAMVLRFGRLTGVNQAERVKQPGLIFALPRPLDRVVRVKTRRIYEAEIQELRYGQPTTEETPASFPYSLGDRGGIDPETEGYCVTGDSNIVQAYIVVKYQLTDPIAYSFGQKDPEMLLRDAMMATVTRSVGEMKIDDVLTEGKKQLATTVTMRAQARLDSAGAGITLQSVEFNELVPPRHVMQDFKNVQNAYIEMETKIKGAQSYKESEVPRAEAERDALKRDAEAYAADTLSTARGAADSFEKLVAEYKKDPVVVRERLYREAVEGIFEWSGRTTVVPPPSGAAYKDMLIILPGEK